MIGIWQLVLIFLIILILFGGGKIPKLMSDLGKGLKSFKKEIESPAPKKNQKKSKNQK